ncbi:hypothetical protein [Spirosoma gilvum]
MQRVIKVLIILLSTTFSIIAYAQSITDQHDVPNQIDPRQYITIQYKKFLNRDKMDTLWNWESRERVPNQKIHLIDIDGEIRIDFSKTGLSQNKEFEGVVSLEAEISGANGTRKIEVNPYSEIGVQRIPIGVKSEAPSEIAKKLLNMLSSVKEADKMYEIINGYLSFTLDDFNLRKTIDSKYKTIINQLGNANPNLEDIKNDAIELRKLATNQLINSNYESRYNLIETLDRSILLARNVQSLRSTISGMINSYNTEYSNSRKRYNKLFGGALEYNIDRTGLVLDYLGSFENAGEDATKAFFLLLNKDLISYKSLKSNLINNQKRLSQINISYREDDPKIDSILLYNSNLITSSTKLLTDLSNFNGTTLERILLKFLENNIRSYSPKVVFDSTLSENTKKKALYFDFIDSYFQTVADSLSTVAGRTIYKKLIYATIDLGKSGAKSGEVMNIYLTWILDSKRDSLANSPRLPVGKYYLRETGWLVEIADMFSLIKRTNEPSINSGPSTVSPSNFKGAGGAVLMWTFNREDRGLNITRKERNSKTSNSKNNQVNHDEFILRRRNRLSNFLEPSIGLNVSYLDFSTEKDVEIGTGLQLGLFRNKIFLGYGINLHMLSPANQSPGYFFVGFSFARLSDLFKSSNSIIAIK